MQTSKPMNLPLHQELPVYAVHENTMVTDRKTASDLSIPCVSLHAVRILIICIFKKRPLALT